MMVMVMVVMMGCNSGGVKGGEGTSGGEGSGLSGVMMEVEKSAEHAFYAFIELVSGVLGLRVTADTTRNQVGEYFTGLASSINKAMQELVKIGNKSKESVKEGKESELDKAVKSAKETLTILKGHIEALKDIGDGNKVVEVGTSQQGKTVDGVKLGVAYDSLKGIVEIAKTQQVKEPKKNDVTIATAKVGGTTPQNGARVLTKDANAGAASGLEAAAIVSAVSGKEILAAIVESLREDATGAAISQDVSKDTSALKFAVGGPANNLAKDVALAGAVSGGIALRSLVKDGKLASHDNNDNKAVQSAGITAVNKLLEAVEDIIKKTLNNTLAKVKDSIDKTRTPKATGQ
ncbi:variable large family protein [Borrelia hispanica]|uniref:variable large family protein n=1 Tax=Borrelia hispanica TaxID=40835 RepID=UPI00389966CE